VNAKEYESVKIYQDLKKNELFGKGTNYLAVNKLTGGKIFYYSSRKRQNGKMGTHEKPSRGYSFKRGEIKNGFNFS
jgi:hypothetical protein